MTVEEIIENIRSIYQALEKGNLEYLLDFFSDDAVLMWGPFRFEGKMEIEKWAKKILGLFLSFHVINKGFNVSENRVYHEFAIEVVTLNMKRGLMPASGIYDFESGMFKRFEINPRDSVLFVDSRLFNSLRL